MIELGPGQKGSGAASFSAVVGQSDLKTGLLAVAANDALDGMLVRGEKGTAKSTTVRALADLLPDQRAVADCPYGCAPDDPAVQCEDCRDRHELPVTERAVPLVTLPLGATRDRVVGTLSVSDALEGEAEFDPGLLARANRGILYVDEVNLLADHLVDVLLDVAASGWNRVERDGVSVTHPADLTLVGTMNPEEGDLRPQLRDRFAIQATVTACDDLEDRVTVVERALSDGGSRDEAARSDGDVRARLLDARDRLAADEVTLPREFAERAAAVPRDAGVDGHRGDIAVARTARTLAALDGRSKVIESDVERAAEFALPHRLQSRPFEDGADLDEVLDEHFDEASDEAGDEGTDDGNGATDGEHDGANSDGSDGDEGGDAANSDDGEHSSGADGAGRENRGDGEGESPGTDGRDRPDRDDADTDDIPRPDGSSGETDGSDGNTGTASTAAEDRNGRGDPDDGSGSDDGSGRDEGTDSSRDGEPSDATPLVPGQSRAAVGDAEDMDTDLDLTGAERADGGSRASAAASVEGEGPRVRTTRPGTDEDEHVDAAASVRAAARNGTDGVRRRDLRASVRAGDASALVVFAVDASASMRPAMETAKGVVLELLQNAYEHRDEVAFVTFAGEDADVLLPPTDSVTLAARHLKDLSTGERTPLPDGLATAGEVIERADPDAAVAVVVTDGRANVAAGSPTAATREGARRLSDVADEVLVVDAAADDRPGLLDVVADVTGARTVPLSALRAGTVDDAVGETNERE